MKIDRLLSILMLLINKEKVTANELAKYFEVSIRTIQRDMDTLNMAGIPLYADVGKKKYAIDVICVLSIVLQALFWVIDF